MATKQQQPNDSLQRSVLPIPDRKPVGVTTYDARDPNTKFPPITPLRPPTGAPNVLVILIDDAGFGSSSAFGGPCQTPNAERLAAGGLRYNRFHSIARQRCSSRWTKRWRSGATSGSRSRRIMDLGTTSSMARSTGCRSTSTSPPRTLITRLARTNDSWSRWRGSEGRLCHVRLWKQSLVWANKVNQTRLRGENQWHRM